MWLGVAAGFAVGAVAAGAIVAVVTGQDSDEPTEQLVASAQLDPLSDTGTAGTAQVLDVDGHRILDVRVDDLRLHNIKVEPEDLERAGPGLVLNLDDGRGRVLVWSE